MVRSLISFFVLLSVFSCRSTRTLEARAKPVYITADPEIFTDTLYPYQYVNYEDNLGFSGTNIELINGQETMAFIHGPTYFSKGGDYFLLYPKEHIRITGSYADFIFSTMEGNKRRDRELFFFKTFQRLHKWPTSWNIPYYNIQTILELEENQKETIPKVNEYNRKLFDSLAKAYQVSKKFKRVTKNYLDYYYDWTLLSLYKAFRDTLQAHGLYKSKLGQLLPAFQNLNKKQLNNNRRFMLNDLRIELFPDCKMWNFDQANFIECFDTIQNHFTGAARAYLLTRLINRAYSKGMKIPSGYEDRYRKQQIPHTYRAYANRVRKERLKFDNNKLEAKENVLLATDGKTQITFDSVMAKYKGKYVLVDLWASWCIPCLAQIPYSQQLEQKYADKKIVFLNISVDKNAGLWNKAWVERYNERGNHYLWTNPVSLFYYRYSITAIPRYLLLDKEGRVINQDAPHPSDPALTLLLDKLLSE